MRMVQTGEILPCMVAEFERGFDAVLAKNKHRREPYYVLYHANWYANNSQLRSVFSPRAKRPPKMLNTMCWLVNNKTGSIKQLWVLPLDAPVEPQIEYEDKIIEPVVESARGMPIVY